MEVAGWFGGAIINKLIDACFEYLGAKLKWPTRMEEELKRLQENQPKIQAIVSAASQAQMMIDPDSPLNKWIWQLRDAIDEADDLLDDFEYRKHEEMLARNREEAGEGSSSNWSSLFGNPPKLRRGQHDLKIDPNLEGLEEVVRKLDKILTEADIFLHLLGRIEKVQQEQQLELYKTRETENSRREIKRHNSAHTVKKKGRRDFLRGKPEFGKNHGAAASAKSLHYLLLRITECLPPSSGRIQDTDDAGDTQVARYR